MVNKWEVVGNHKNKTIMLIGEYTHSIDDKNRVSLPAKFRSELGKKIVITAGLDNCLWIFKGSEWSKIEQKLNEFSIGQADSRSFSRFMFSSAVEAEVDSIGRILIPDFLRDRANLKNKVVVTGVSSRVEVWNEKTWADYKKVVEKQADTLAEKLGQVGVL
jgi:MraZ protein